MARGFSVPKRKLERLEILERTPSGRAKSYVDPVSGEIFTQYQLQRARNFGLTPAQAAAARKVKIGKTTAYEIAKQAHKRHEHIPILFERAAGMQSESKNKLMKDPNFWKRVRDLAKQQKQPTKGKALHYFGYVPSPTIYESDGDSMDNVDDIDAFDFGDFE